MPPQGYTRALQMGGTTVRLWTIKTPIWITLCTSVYCFIFWYYHKIMSSFIHFFQLFFLPVQFVDKLWFKFTFLQVYKWLIFYKFKWRKYVDPFFYSPRFLEILQNMQMTCTLHTEGLHCLLFFSLHGCRGSAHPDHPPLGLSPGQLMYGCRLLYPGQWHHQEPPCQTDPWPLCLYHDPTDGEVPSWSGPSHLQLW